VNFKKVNAATKKILFHYHSQNYNILNRCKSYK
jgi:hypothetical protein